MELEILSATECWEKVPSIPPAPQPRSQMIAFVFPELRCDDGVIDGLSAVPSTPSLARHAWAVAGRIKEGAENILDSRHAGTRYSFIPPDSCSEDCESDGEEDWAKSKTLKQLPREMYRDIKRPSDFQRLNVKCSNKPNQSRSIMKDLTKVKMSILSPLPSTPSSTTNPQKALTARVTSALSYFLYQRQK